MPQLKKCNECSVELTSENSYYPKITNHLCKTHYIRKRQAYSNAYIKANRPKGYGYIAKYLDIEEGKRRFREAQQEYNQSKKGRKKRSEANKRAYFKHKYKFITRAKTRDAVKKGIINKPNKCEACKQVKPLQAHHHDYTKHLEVTWLCSRCHADTHNKIKNS